MKKLRNSIIATAICLSCLSIPSISLAKTDKVKPKIYGATNKTIYMGSVFNSLSKVTAKDNVDGNITKLIKVSGFVNTKKAGKYKLVYTVSDRAKNKTTVIRTITVKKDTIRPSIYGASNKIIYIGSSFKSLTGVTAKDNADGNITKWIKVYGSVNAKKAGKYKLVYTVSDKAKNTTTVTRIITVVDNIKPIISGVRDTQIFIGEKFDPLEGVSAFDNNDGDLTSDIKVVGDVNVNKAGAYVITYSVSDHAENTVILKRKVTVVDNIKPVLSGIFDIEINYGEKFNPLAGITAFDNNDGDLTKSIRVVGKVDTQTPGSYILTYSVSDKAGNTTTIKRVITVKDMPLTLLELNKDYVSPDNNMTVNVKEISITDAGGYIQYTFNYTQKNNTINKKIDEGTFKIYFTDGSSEPQYGFFSTLYPGETVDRSYTFKVLKGKKPICIEYAADNFFSTKPKPNTLKWELQ